LELEAGFGDEWWRKGLLVAIRTACSVLQEEPFPQTAGL